MGGNLIEKTFNVFYYNLRNFNVTGWLLLASDSLISSYSEKDPALFQMWILNHCLKKKKDSCSICAEVRVLGGILGVSLKQSRYEVASSPPFSFFTQRPQKGLRQIPKEHQGGYLLMKQAYYCTPKSGNVNFEKMEVGNSFTRHNCQGFGLILPGSPSNRRDAEPPCHARPAAAKGRDEKLDLPGSSLPELFHKTDLIPVANPVPRSGRGKRGSPRDDVGSPKGEKSAARPAKPTGTFPPREATHSRSFLRSSSSFSPPKVRL